VIASWHILDCPVCALPWLRPELVQTAGDLNKENTMSIEYRQISKSPRTLALNLQRFPAKDCRYIGWVGILLVEMEVAPFRMT
jgi:hypothetical protein